MLYGLWVCKMELQRPQHYRKPNIRALFKPDPGMLLVDADLSGADAQVVFAEAEEWDTVARLRTGVKLHVETATAFFGARFTDAAGDVKNKLTPRGRMYDACKRGAHASSYGAAPRTVAAALGWTESEASRFQRLYMHELHPGIGKWQERVEVELRTTRRTTNKFGYSVYWFGRIDSLLPEALAWSPQGTVAICTYRAAEQVRTAYPYVEFLLQVHDSLVFQIPLGRVSELAGIAAALEVPVPYSQPLIIPWKLAVSDHSWGEAKPWSAPQ